MNTHINSTLQIIFNYNKYFIKDITPVNFHTLKMGIKYSSYNIVNQTKFKFYIKNQYDNPFNGFSNDEIRVKYLKYLYY
jgi:hypothetical protein